jgi:hypothetical protein
MKSAIEGLKSNYSVRKPTMIAKNEARIIMKMINTDCKKYSN